MRTRDAGDEPYRVDTGNTRPKSHYTKKQLEAAKAQAAADNERAKQQRRALRNIEQAESTAMRMVEGILLAAAAAALTARRTPTGSSNRDLQRALNGGNGCGSSKVVCR